MTYTGQVKDWTETAMTTKTGTSMSQDLHRSGTRLDNGTAERQNSDLDEHQDEDLDEP